MNKRQTDAFNRAQEAILALPEVERVDVLTALRHNGIFCFECGFGSHERPNADCQCWNDE